MSMKPMPSERPPSMRPGVQPGNSGTAGGRVWPAAQDDDRLGGRTRVRGPRAPRTAPGFNTLPPGHGGTLTRLEYYRFRYGEEPPPPAAA